MTKGVKPWSLAYVLALATIQAGVSLWKEQQKEPGLVKRDRRKQGRGDKSLRDTEVKNLALKDKGVKGVHNFLDGSSVIPPVEVEDVDVL
jgi:hypothetical protein